MEQSLQAVARQNNLTIWAERVQACRSSGLTVGAWCSENGIVPNTYYRWQKKVFNAMHAEEASFYEVRMLKSSSKAAVSIELNGISAKIHQGADEETILAVLRAMGSC